MHRSARPASAEAHTADDVGVRFGVENTGRFDVEVTGVELPSVPGRGRM